MTALRQSFHSETTMHNQNLEAAERLFEPAKPAPAISDYERERLALYANRDRLRAERLAREAERSA
jgi:hypothetical protein